MSSNVKEMGNHFSGLFDILLDPASVVSRLDSRAAWLIPFLVVGIGGIVLGFASLPITASIVRHSLPVGLADDQVQQSLRTFLTFQRIGLAISPLILLLKWLVMGWILYMSCVLLDVPARFKSLFALTAQCSMVSFLQQAVSYAIIKLKGNEVQSATDLAPALGLDLLIRGLDGPMMALVSYFSVFTLWYIVVLGLGLSYLTGCSKTRAFLVSVPSWLLPLVLTIGLATLSN